MFIKKNRTGIVLHVGGPHFEKKRRQFTKLAHEIDMIITLCVIKLYFYDNYESNMYNYLI